MTSDKVPTILDYEADVEDPSWGYEVVPGVSNISYIRLLLDDRQEFPDWITKPDLVLRLHTAGKTTLQVITDYHSQLRDVATDELNKRFSAGLLSTNEIHWVLTVPAVWSDAAKQTTTDAAKAAGIDTNLHIISEPEAAAIWSLATMHSRDVQIGDVYIVCDAGGGTVDLITFQVQSLDPIRFKEVVSGTGGLCGSAFINFGFENLLKQKLGPHRFSEYRKRSPKMWKAAIDNFDQVIKPSFNPSKAKKRTRSFEIVMPGITDDKSVGIEDGVLTITSNEVEGLFAPVVKDVIRLIQKQKDAAVAAGTSPKDIILVGGLGQSAHLYNCIKLHFVDHIHTPSKKRSYSQMADRASNLSAKGDLVLLKPTYAWTAIVRGAALSGVNGVDIVSSRKARRHYGTVVNQRFDASCHTEDCRSWCLTEEEWKAGHQMSWFIRKGDETAAGVPILKDFYHTNSYDSKDIEIELWSCDEDEAPQTKGPGVYRLCSFKVAPSIVPAKAFGSCQTLTGKSYTKLRYKLGMHIGSGGLRFDFRVDDQVCGYVDAKFD